MTGIAFIFYSDLPADLPYQFYGIYVFIVLFGAGVLLAWLASRRDWHRKYVDYRALAEGLRVQRWWRRAGIAASRTSAFAHDNFMQKQDIELGWIRNVMRAASMDRMDNTPVPEGALATVICEWIGEPGSGGQLEYYTRKTVYLSRMHRRTRGLGRACFWVGISVGVFLALFQLRLGTDNTNSLVAVMGVLAIIAAARESYAYRKGDKELIKQYQYMFGIFANARIKLDATHDGEGKREILRALGEAALAEHSAWALMHRDRPLENARRAPCHHENKNSLADAIVLETYFESASTRKAGERFAFVTHNTSDFSTPGGNQKLPHPNFGGQFSKIRSMYFISLAELLRRVDPSMLNALIWEQMWEQEPRGLSELLAAHEVLWRQVWYNRHKYREWMINEGKLKLVSREEWEHGSRDNQHQIIDDIWKGALKAVKRTKRELGKGNVGPWADFE